MICDDFSMRLVIYKDSFNKPFHVWIIPLSAQESPSQTSALYQLRRILSAVKGKRRKSEISSTAWERRFKVFQPLLGKNKGSPEFWKPCNYKRSAQHPCGKQKDPPRALKRKNTSLADLRTSVARSTVARDVFCSFGDRERIRTSDLPLRSDEEKTKT